MIVRNTIFTNDQLAIRQTFRSAYNTAGGRRELTRLLADLGTFTQIKPEALALRNFGIMKLEELGFLDEEFIETMINFAFDNAPLTSRLSVEEIERLKENEDGQS